MIASQLYGLQTSIFLRITDTVIGIVFASSFYYLYEKCISSRIKAAT